MTIIFRDGQSGTTMETAGNFSAWTGTTVTGASTLNVVNTNFHHGANCGESNVPGLTFQSGYAHKTLSSTLSNAYLRWYAYIVSETAGVNWFNLGGMRNATLATVQAAVGIVSATRNIRLAYVDDTTGAQSDTSATTFPVGEWHCIELYRRRHATLGTINVWLDGVNLADIQQDNKDFGDEDVANVYCGIGGNARGDAVVDWDCVIASDVYNGPEPLGSPSRRLLRNMGL